MNIHALLSGGETGESERKLKVLLNMNIKDKQNINNC